MVVFVVVQWSSVDIEDPDIVGVFSSLKQAKHVASTYTDWDLDQCEPDDLFWASEDYNVQVISKDLDQC